MSRAEQGGRLQALILRTIQDSNILPLTSACNLSCLFCSHRQNPPGLDVFRLPRWGVAEVEELLEWLDPSRPIVTGESATRIIEGDPLCYPHWREVFTALRRRFRSTPLQVTTNGTRLDDDAVRFLAGLGAVSVYLSLNSADPGCRLRLLGDQQPQRAIEAPGLLFRYGVPFHGSLVAMPHITGWDDLKGTVEFLAAHGAQTVRVFLPGYSRLAGGETRIPAGLWPEAADFVEALRPQCPMPLLLEPARLDNLKPISAGVIPGSPADLSGLPPYTEVTRVEGEAPRSRVDAYWQLWRGKNPLVEAVGPGGQAYAVRLQKGERVTAGLVFEYDVDPADIEAIAGVAGSTRVLVLTGVMAAPLLEMACLDAGLRGVEVEAVENSFFGGSIGCAGLLVVEDIAVALSRRLERGPRPDIVLVPARAFDIWGRDLRGWSLAAIGEQWGIEVRAV